MKLEESQDSNNKQQFCHKTNHRKQPSVFAMNETFDSLHTNILKSFLTTYICR